MLQLFSKQIPQPKALWLLLPPLWKHTNQMMKRLKPMILMPMLLLSTLQCLHRLTVIATVRPKPKLLLLPAHGLVLEQMLLLSNP